MINTNIFANIQDDCTSDDSSANACVKSLGEALGLIYYRNNDSTLTDGTLYHNFVECVNFLRSIDDDISNGISEGAVIDLFDADSTLTSLQEQYQGNLNEEQASLLANLLSYEYNGEDEASPTGFRNCVNIDNYVSNNSTSS
jgi:hypothetical protein